ncbi:hypothetical protein HYH03_018481 [Edaphochlamys debaryana]|uniref:Uncharacterized protein n=1 Tax=Edaphochlamys debaryana TaxID=47281 RepID=A0A835XDP7_9CHLO|nr:hypothetical protein HYH03_018481 [Edaphochlamys debaryana]|eukprot:KAG2482597.1 hypothetical protein HYH03_018481 [Edaphochlamys debaryana]
MDVEPLFKPFRALGYITDNVPFAVSRRGKETYVTVSVGKAWQVYNTTKLLLSLVGPQLPGDVRALAVKGDLTFAAVGGDIIECKRVHRTGTYRSPPGCGPVRQLLPLGEALLALCGPSQAAEAAGEGGRLVVWEVGSHEEPTRVLDLGPGFQPTCMAHPDTYLNKVLVGSEGGQLALWNFRTGTRLHTFKGWGSPVRCLAASPALDVVGVGLGDGRAVLHNVRFDEEVAVFANASGSGLAAEGLLGGGAGTAAASGRGGGGCCALAFRSGAGLPLLAAGGGGGAVTVWNLEERRLHTVLREAHDGALISLHFFPGEPLLMSSAADNSLKHWAFDSADAAPRLLRFRAGHSAPPTLVRHYGEGGLRLLSAGCDRSFRVFSVHQDQQSRELSQHHTARRAKRLKLREAELKLGRVVDMDACEVRERDWANALTAHEGDPSAYTWRLAAFTLGEHVLTPPPEELHGAPAAPVTCVALSRCGNFGLVGSASGRLDRYNLQSGLHRGAYSRRPAQGAQRGGPQRGGAAAKGGAATAPLPAHSGAVVGAAVDSSNGMMASAGLDGVLRVWDFRRQQLRAEVSLGQPASRLALHPGSGLAAVALADGSLRLFDVEVPRLVRRFAGHRDRVTGLHISQDGRWLLSSSMDGTLRVWDIPSAACLQVLRLGAPVTSLSLGPSLDLLATTHVNRRGIYLWTNQALFGTAPAVPLGEGAVPTLRAALPSISSGRAGGRGGEAEGEEGAAGAQEEEEDCEDEDGDSGDEEEAASRRRAAAAAAEAAAAAAAPAPYAARDPVSGAPLPLAPELVTLSLLPRSQWDSLVHIEVIKARNKPLQPPTKPQAAPFFLPTLPGLDAQPVFDPAAAEAGAAAAGAEAGAGGAEGGAQPPGWGEGSEEEEGGSDRKGEDGEGGAGPGPGSAAAAPGGRSRIVARKGGRAAAAGAAGPVSEFVRLLRSCAAAASKAGAEGGEAALEAWGPLLGALRGMRPTAIDRELRALEPLPGSSDEAAAASDLGSLMDALAASLEGGRDFEFCQALLAVLLQVGGEAIASRPELLARAGRLRGAVAAGWRRLDALLQHSRCVVGFLGNLQG